MTIPPWLLHNLLSNLILGLISKIIGFIKKISQVLIGWPKEKEIPPNVKEATNRIQITIINNYGDKNVIAINPHLEEDFIQEKDGELTPKISDNVLTTISDNYEKYVFLKVHAAIYPFLRPLLTPEASLGLDFYLSYKSAINEGNEQLLSQIKKGVTELKNLGYSNLSEWFDIFSFLDSSGIFEGIILTKANEITNIPTKSRATKEVFTRFIRFLYDGLNKGFEEPFKEFRTTLILIGEKPVIKYVMGIAHAFEESDCKEVIVCALGNKIPKAVDAVEIVKGIYKNLKYNIIPASASHDIQNRVKGPWFSAIHIFLSKG